MRACTLVTGRGAGNTRDPRRTTAPFSIWCLAGAAPPGSGAARSGTRRTLRPLIGSIKGESRSHCAGCAGCASRGSTGLYQHAQQGGRCGAAACCVRLGRAGGTMAARRGRVGSGRGQGRPLRARHCTAAPPRSLHALQHACYVEPRKQQQLFIFPSPPQMARRAPGLDPQAAAAPAARWQARPAPARPARAPSTVPWPSSRSRCPRARPR